METKSLEVLEKSQLPPEQARAILQVMEEEFATDELATKADLERFATKADFERFATKADLAELKAELMKWTFLFWVGQMAAVLAIIKYLK